jgi:hypothetical protein
LDCYRIDKARPIHSDRWLIGSGLDGVSRSLPFHQCNGASSSPWQLVSFFSPSSHGYMIIPFHPSSLTIATYCPYNFSLNSLTLALAAPIHSPTTSIPALPAYPPIPSCLTNLIFGSVALVDLDFDFDDEVGSVESSAMVIVVGQSGSSNADGSGKRYLLSERRDGCQRPFQYLSRSHNQMTHLSKIPNVQARGMLLRSSFRFLVSVLEQIV